MEDIKKEAYVEVDKNMIVTDTIGDREVTWYDVKQAPFSLHGFYEPLTEPFFRRLPADAVHDAYLLYLHRSVPPVGPGDDGRPHLHPAHR